MTENEEIKSNRDKQLERLRGKYPDKKFEDDEEIFAQIGEDYDQLDQLDQTNKGYAEREQKLSDMFAADPRSAQLLVDMYQGRSPMASFVRMFGPEVKDCLDDPDKAEEIAKAETEYAERLAKSQQLDREYEANMEATLETLRTFKQERGLTDEKVDAVVALLLGIVRDGIMGKFSPEVLDMAMKALNHDNDVAAAAEEGEIAGRNAKIQERLRRSKQGDGIASLDGKNSTVPGQQNRRPAIFALADEAR